jgi:hypothetical protein
MIPPQERSSVNEILILFTDASQSWWCLPLQYIQEGWGANEIRMCFLLTPHSLSLGYCNASGVSNDFGASKVHACRRESRFRRPPSRQKDRSCVEVSATSVCRVSPCSSERAIFRSWYLDRWSGNKRRYRRLSRAGFITTPLRELSQCGSVSMDKDVVRGSIIGYVVQRRRQCQ